MKDVILTWNDVFLQTIRIAGGPPGPISRTGAMMHLAMYDAVNAMLPAAEQSSRYLSGIATPPADSNKEYAAIYAAYTVLRYLYTAKDGAGKLLYTKQFSGYDQAKADAINTMLDAKLDQTTLMVPFDGMNAATGTNTPANKTNGKNVGTAIANLMIASRTGDHADDPNFKPYPFDNETLANVGRWRNTGSGPAASPQWGEVTPFGGFAVGKFRPSLPGAYANITDLLASNEYASQYNEVKELGAYNSAARTAEQTEIAFFWANDLDGTSKPPGQLFQATQIVAMQKGYGLAANSTHFADTARLFALAAMTMADAAIVAWDAKYDTVINLWRPETAIHDAWQHSNHKIEADGNWKPLSANTNGTRFSPNFPAYISGHATFGAAHAGAMRNFFGTDNVTFELTTEDPHAVTDEDGVRKTRTFNSFTDAALENARSRVYLGVHYQWDGDNGFLSGSRLANFIANRFLNKPGVPATVSETEVDAEAAIHA